eukprot:3752381-Rhodomonas_salina.2
MAVDPTEALNSLSTSVLSQGRPLSLAASAWATETRQTRPSTPSSTHSESTLHEPNSTDQPLASVLP